MKKIFINRKAELQKLSNGLKRGRDYVLVAPRRYGKTTLSLKVLEEIKQGDNYIIIDIDLMTYSGGSIRSIAECILEKTLNALGMLGKLRRMWHQTNVTFNLKVKYQDLEIEPLFHVYKNADEWTLLEESLQLFEKVAIQTKKKVIVFFDEFGELYSLGERIIKVFRSVIQRHEHVSYLFSGSQETVMNKIFLDKTGAFYRFGELVYLKELNIEDVYKYLIDKFPLNNHITGIFDMKILDEVVSTLKGHPYYTAQVVEFFEDNPNCNFEQLYNFLNVELLNRERAYLELQIQKLNDDKQYAVELLRILSLELNPFTELSFILKPNISRTLKYLENSGYIRKESRGQYIVTDPLMIKLLLD